MKINTNVVLLNLEDKPFKKSGDESFLLGDALIDGLGAVTKRDEEVELTTKLDKFKLMLKIRESQKGDGVLEVNFDELKMLREGVARHPNVVLVGRVMAHLQLTGEEK